MTEDKRIPITDAKSGLTRYSEPNPYPPPSGQQAAPGETGAGDEQQANSPDAAGKASESAGGTSEQAKKGNKQSSNKPKNEIKNLEQFIAHAYRLKGKRVPLKAKVERQIAQDPRLSEEALKRLSELVNRDKLFAVPRQLLLVARQVEAYPGLRGALREFVRERMLEHPLFSQSDLQAAISNLEGALPPEMGLKALVQATKGCLAEKQAKFLKDSEFNQLRTNAANCLAIWLAETRGLSLPNVIDMLYATLWAPAAKKLDTDTSKLEALTGMADFAGIGVACEGYRRQANECLVASEAAARQSEDLRGQVASLQAKLASANAAIEEARAALERTEAELKGQIESVRKDAGTEAAHLRHDLEQQRTRLLRRLDADVRMLEQGLQALTRNPPKVHIMIDHAERVTEALREEIKQLKGDD